MNSRITKIAFRPDGTMGGASFTQDFDLQITLSTTEKTLSTVESTFDNNFGNDKTIVLSRRTTTLSSNNDEDPESTSTPPSRLFDFIIDLVNQFEYNPNAGNLLLEVKLYGITGVTSFFDSKQADTVGDSFVGWLAANNPNPNLGVESDEAQGNLVNLRSGLVTQFTFEPITTTEIVVPNANELVEGNRNSDIPFNQPDLTVRYQQVYLASQFESVPSNSQIAKIAFRGDSQLAGFEFDEVYELEVRLSITDATPSTLSPFFDQNIGAVNSLVFSRDEITLSSDYLEDPNSTSDPKSRMFDICINLETPFEYIPSDGNNLLLELKIFEGADIFRFDAQMPDTGGAAAAVTGRVFQVNMNPSTGVNSATGAVDGDLGLVTKFSYV